jgi:hypothetical protein
LIKKTEIIKFRIKLIINEKFKLFSIEFEGMKLAVSFSPLNENIKKLFKENVKFLLGNDDSCVSFESKSVDCVKNRK